MIPWLRASDPFPPVHTALTDEDGAAGLLAAGADLSPQRLLLAYRNGIFPWFSEGQPVLWWSTDPRMVLATNAFKVSSSLKKMLRKVHLSMAAKGAWQIRFDSAFEPVMRACAAPRNGVAGTWISEEIVAGYAGLHALGYAHSVELWYDGTLAAGAYGVCIGRMFYGESMFTTVSDGSKVTLAYLVHFLQRHGVAIIDCQQQTSHLASLGARPIPRAIFLTHLETATKMPPIENWNPLPLY
ncbi:MAG: leucyl/phenylalanyl-tRNA--protein transferase [Pseudomonadota bacterium]